MRARTGTEANYARAWRERSAADTRHHTAPEPSVYQCAECRDGKHLMAWAGANVYGPLAADGELECHDAVEEWGLHEDSIQCSVHPDGAIEKRIGGYLHRWWSCPKCAGKGRTHIGVNWQAPDGYPCTGSTAVHQGWRPIDAPAAAVVAGRDTAGGDQ